jgi:Flp pilus assembly protein TadB
MDTTALDCQLSDFVHVLIKALRSGYSLRQSLEAMAETAPEPTASALKGWLADLEAGCTYDEAFVHMQVAWPSPYLAQIVSTIVATIARNQESGGNLAAQLEPLCEQIYQAVGTDEAFYPEMRRQAEQLGGPLPERVRKE